MNGLSREGSWVGGQPGPYTVTVCLKTRTHFLNHRGFSDSKTLKPVSSLPSLFLSEYCVTVPKTHTWSCQYFSSGTSSASKFPMGAGDLAQWLRALCCSCRGPVFGSQHPYQVGHNNLKFQLQGPGCPFLASMGNCSYGHIHINNIHINKNKPKIFKTCWVSLAWWKIEPHHSGSSVRRIMSWPTWEDPILTKPKSGVWLNDIAPA